MANCIRCDAEFFPKKTGRPRKYCQRCSDAWGGYIPSNGGPYKCLNCDKEFFGRKKTFCGPECGKKFRDRPKSYSVVCRGCENNFTSHHGSTAYCTNQCRNSHRERKRYKSVGWWRVSRKCPVCENEFTPAIPKQKFCSNRCRRRHFGNIPRERWKQPEKPKLPAVIKTCKECNSEFSKGFKFCSVRCRKTHFNRIKLVAKYERKTRGLPEFCEICNENRTLDYCHIVPRSDGGPFSSGNLLRLCPTHHRLFDEGMLNIAELEKLGVGFLYA